MEQINKKNLRRRSVDYGTKTNRSKLADDSKRLRLFNQSNPNKTQLTGDSRFVVAAKIATLNNSAVDLYIKRDFENASGFFEEATLLRLISDSLFPPKVLFDLSRPPNNKMTWDKGTDAAKTYTMGDSAVPLTSNYMYQRTEFDEGISLYCDTKVIHDGDHHLSAKATLLFNAGQARRELGDLVGAVAFYGDALSVLLPNLETDEATHFSPHRIVVPVLHNLGQIAYRMGAASKAIWLYEIALVHCRVLNGERSLSVASTLNCLGVMHYHSPANDDSDQAIRYFLRALDVLHEVMGSASEYEATILNNLGRAYVHYNEFDLAFESYDQSLAIRKHYLGPDHVDYAATAFNAGQSLHHKGALYFDRAMELYGDFLRVALVRFSKKHRDVAVVLSGMAQIHQERKEYPKALKLYEEALEVAKEALGNFHLEVAVICNRIGNFHFERGHCDKALEAYKEGLHIELRLFERTHPNIIVTMSNIGGILRQKGSLECAIRIYKDVVKLQTMRYGKNSAEVATTLSVIGMIYDQNGNSDKALVTLQRALAIRRSATGVNDVDICTTLTLIGTILYRKSMVSTAIEFFSESLSIRRIKLGKNHRSIAYTLYNIGLCHQSLGNLNQAVDCYKETLRIEKMVLGEDHKDISMTLLKLGEACKAKGDLDEALDVLNYALAIERSTKGQDNPAAVVRIINEIGTIHLEKGDFVPMMEAFCEASTLFQQAGLTAESIAMPGALYHIGIIFPSGAPAA
ncbi:unnamed protein product [Pseudo-nitzschia multistriata]|uniref:Uncharacterized protein n=1 Tax=Pseudo-nitzschia multistriata TaxID=183589 RepID=A0A448ZEQ3_9STRA|nr:unnamed protein product [Pseudo-nitzschia multistriata]